MPRCKRDGGSNLHNCPTLARGSWFMADAGGAAAASTAQPASLAAAGVELEAARLRRIKISDWIARNTAELARLKTEREPEGGRTPASRAG